MEEPSEVEIVTDGPDYDERLHRAQLSSALQSSEKNDVKM